MPTTPTDPRTAFMRAPTNSAGGLDETYSGYVCHTLDVGTWCEHGVHGGLRSALLCSLVAERSGLDFVIREGAFVNRGNHAVLTSRGDLKSSLRVYEALDRHPVVQPAVAAASLDRAIQLLEASLRDDLEPQPFGRITAPSQCALSQRPGRVGVVVPGSPDQGWACCAGARWCGVVHASRVEARACEAFPKRIIRSVMLASGRPHFGCTLDEMLAIEAQHGVGYLEAEELDDDARARLAYAARHAARSVPAASPAKRTTSRARKVA